VITAKAFAGKKYAVYGLARSGLATAAALIGSGAEVSGWDARQEARAKSPEGTRIQNLDEADLGNFDSIVVTPGLPLNRHPIAERARNAGTEIIGDVELFARARPELAAHKVVGITGTNGKSTTTALVHHILNTAGVATAMGGNIGLPILAQDPLPAGGVYVLELSSYQIDLTRSLDCDIAVLLNITPDHLDRYDTFHAYAASKARLFEMQTDRHPQVISRDTQPSCDEYEKRWSVDHGRVVAIGADQIGDQTAWPALQGPHNAENASAAIAVSRLLGLSDDKIDEGLRTYAGLPHRMERTRQIDGVLFVNDSKATNPTATAPALASFDRIRWICGGQPKTDNLDECSSHFGHVVKAYTIGEAGELFARLLSPHMAVAECGTLDRAIGAAAAEARSGDTVLLSPACASFDQFRSFEDRGDRFRALVGAL
jgi:UDP-N-acetylmuramoylalanine--D-glutamate ligase